MRKLSEIPREQYKYEHQKLWTWLSEYPEDEKEEYFNAVFSDFEEMKNKNSQWAYCCFACVYCDGVCAVCPIMWQNGNCLRGEYGDYIAAKGISDNESINHDAKVISSLPWRDEQ